MAKKKRSRRLHSKKTELITKSREAALAAVQIFNSPSITFKAEIYIVLMIIAWTYLLHAYYRQERVEYRYFSEPEGAKRRRFDRTKHGAFKYWELERCLNDDNCPVDPATISNLRFLIGVRHEIEHQMTSKIDASFSAKFQACCLNYNDYIVKLFGKKFGIGRHLAFSLQLTQVTKKQVEDLADAPILPGHLEAFVTDFEQALSQAEFDDARFAYRVLFVPKTANRKGQADEVIEFVRHDSELAKGVNASYAVIKETERPKHRPSWIVRKMNAEGYKKFTMHNHTKLWQAEDAKATDKGYGVQVEETWFWYDKWVEVVRAHCAENAVQYGKKT